VNNITENCPNFAPILFGVCDIAWAFFISQHLIAVPLFDSDSVCELSQSISREITCISPQPRHVGSYWWWRLCSSLELLCSLMRPTDLVWASEDSTCDRSISCLCGNAATLSQRCLDLLRQCFCLVLALPSLGPVLCNPSEDLPLSFTSHLFAVKLPMSVI
jgi:hypothetical protein